MEHENCLKNQIKDLKEENALLKQEIRGFKKYIKELRPTFKMERDDDIHNIIISFWDKKIYKYQPFIIFNLDIGVDNSDVEFMAKQVYEKLMEIEYD